MRQKSGAMSVGVAYRAAAVQIVQACYRVCVNHSEEVAP